MWSYFTLWPSTAETCTSTFRQTAFFTRLSGKIQNNLISVIAGVLIEEMRREIERPLSLLRWTAGDSSRAQLSLMVPYVTEPRQSINIISSLLQKNKLPSTNSISKLPFFLNRYYQVTIKNMLLLSDSSINNPRIAAIHLCYVV